MAKILIVDDEEEIRILYQRIVSEMGHEVFLAQSAEEAKSVILSEDDLDVCLVDRVMPGDEDGLDILKFIQVKHPFCQCILISGYPTFTSASEALRWRAFDYLVKPVTTAQLCHVIDTALKENAFQKERVLDAERNKKGYDELKLKQEMLQHDMRSALIGIIGFANALVKKTTLDERQLGYCKEIQRCGTQLQNMINTYLAVSNLEIETFRFNRTQFNLLDAVQQSRKTLHFLADDKNVDISIIYNKRMLSVDDNLSYEGDRMYLQNAIDNLLKNAIEASPPDGRVKIKIKDPDKYPLISVHNWGTVPEDVRSKFFEKGATSGKKDGRGLGTYIAKLVVQAHGGQISFNSSEDEGTEVSIILPSLETR